MWGTAEGSNERRLCIYLSQSFHFTSSSPFSSRRLPVSIEIFLLHTQNESEKKKGKKLIVLHFGDHVVVRGVINSGSFGVYVMLVAYLPAAEPPLWPLLLPHMFVESAQDQQEILSNMSFGHSY